MAGQSRKGNGVSHNVCHTVTNDVSHTCPDQTRPDQIVFTPVGGKSKTKLQTSPRQASAALWLLALAGLSLKVSPPLPEPLVLVSREQKIFDGWFRKYIREDEAGCWIWHGARFRGGYGAVGWDGSTRCAHRVIWELMVCDLPRRLDLDHLCRVRACVNPDHLEPVTRSMNLIRGAHPTQGRLGRERP